ncbi:MAG: response regulator, partial [Butyrivibrio sp.]|nr:response regulator [Butyrivibrio sp.]
SNMITFRARSKDLDFHVDVDETIPDKLYGDEVRVRQIITNLLTNAVKYTHEGSVTLSVGCEKTAPPASLTEGKEDAPALAGGITLVIDVKDTGIGIKDEDLGNLFTKFGRVDLTQTNTIEGTGLGLAITENLLLMMQGEIKVQSVYGEGSTFSVRIPQGVVSEEAIGDFHRRYEDGLKSLKAYHESFRAPDAHVLVVDDTELNLVVIEGLLKTTEVRLDTASGGEEALVLCKKTAYDLILLDQRMPRMNGTETLRHNRTQEDGRNRETPVICLTADAVQCARERYLAEGFSGYLSKPVEGPALEAALTEYLPAEKILRTAEGGGSAPDATPRPGDVGFAQTAVMRPEGSGSASTVQAAYESIPALDYTQAGEYLASDELIEKTLRSFYENLRDTTDVIGRTLREEDYDNFTIRVHALKSGARMIGAAEISELAAKLEACGDVIRKQAQPVADSKTPASADNGKEMSREEALHFMREETPKLLSSLETLLGDLNPYFQKEEKADADAPEISREELDELYEAITEFAAVYDQESILGLLRQTDAYRIPDADRKKLEQIRKYVSNSDWNGLQYCH